ncbi:MAG: NlpC/P60 family protein [Thermomicrobiales bacterium]
MKLRTSSVRKRLMALIGCSLIVTIGPLSATAEYGIPAGSGATITAGQPLLVRVSPGWDAEVAYEIADGSYVTVWGAEQAAPDGSLWYPIDGGFVPAEGVTSEATLDGGVALYQDAAPDATADPNSLQGWVDPSTGQWVDPNTAQGWTDPSTGQWVDPSTAQGWVDPNTGQWVDASAAQTQETQGWVDPATGEWVDPSAQTQEAPAQGWIDPNTGQWVDASTAQGWVDPNTGQWVDGNTASDGWIDPATGEWVDPNAQQGWIDPNTGQWVVSFQQEAAPADVATDVEAAPSDVPADVAPVAAVDATDTAATDPNASTDGWVDPNTGEWVEPGKTDEWVDDSAAPADEWTEPAPVEVVNDGGPEPWAEPIATAYIAGTNGDGAACRVAPERGSEKLAVLGEGESVEVRGEAVGEWQPVNCAGVGGYVNASFVSWEPVAAPEREGKVNRSRNGGGEGAGDQGMVGFAMQYVGYPYSYGGEGPYSFDCSGFTKFVAMNALGLDITHDMFTQIDMGQSVDRNSLQPGDLVFFANTFRPGLSHVGIYIGDGQFVHAENESTGVRVSDLNSDYYGSRWAGATRLAS